MTKLRVRTAITILLCWAGLPLVAADVAPISIGVSPPRFEVELGGRSTGESLRVFNFGEEPAEVEVSVQNWTLDEDNQLQLLEPVEQSLASWMIINPLKFTVAPGAAQTVRFSIRPRVEPTPGEHRAIIFLKQAPAPNPDKSMLRVVGRVGIAVYAYSGPVKRASTLNDLSVDPHGPSPVVTFDISSMGDRHVRMDGRYTIWPKNQYPGLDAERPENAEQGFVATGDLPGTPVLPDTRRQLSVALQSSLPPGEYVFEADGQLGDEPLRQTVSFVVGTASVAQGAAD